MFKKHGFPRGKLEKQLPLATVGCILVGSEALAEPRASRASFKNKRCSADLAAVTCSSRSLWLCALATGVPILWEASVTKGTGKHVSRLFAWATIPLLPLPTVCGR